MTVISSCAIYQKHVNYKRLFMFYSCKITQCTGPTSRKYIAMKVSVTNYIHVLNVSKNICERIPLRSAILKYREYFTGEKSMFQN